MDLETLVKCLADHYSWNEEASNLRRLEGTLRELAAEVHELATEIESNASA